MAKNLFKIFIPNILKEIKKRNKIGKQFIEWDKLGYGYPVPCHRMVKESVINKYQQKYNYKTFIETGTCKGDMIEALKNSFQNIWSIELDDDLYKGAKKRFENEQKITVIKGDSGEILPQIINNLKEPAIFWLDAHYSGGKTAKGNKNTPILEEINAILKNAYDHIILIDDARSFYSLKDYPTIEELRIYVQSKDNSYIMEVENDIIRFFRKK